MKFTIRKNSLVECLKNINSLIDSNNLNPTLTAVHIRAANNKVVFIATNGSSSYQQTINEVEVKEAGDILVKARLLYNYTSKVDQEMITFNQIDEKILQISSPKFFSEINLIDDTSFPIIDFDFNGWKKVTITYDTLVNISQRIKPFVSNTYSTTNPATNGIYFNPIDEKQMECVASDPFKMAYYKFDYTGDVVKFIIEPKAIDMAIEVLTHSKNKSIDLYLSEKECILNINETLIKFSLYKNNYPNIINAILSQQKYSFTIKLNDLFNALSRGSVFVEKEQRPSANFKIEGNKLIIKFISNETGNSSEEIELLKSNVKDFEVRLNQKYLINLINTIKSENITFNFNGGNSPIIISSDNPYFLNLITPIRSL